MKQIQEFICILCVCDVRMYMDQGLYTLLHIRIYIYIYIYNNKFMYIAILLHNNITRCV